jgi:hypothetical protein
MMVYCFEQSLINAILKMKESFQLSNNRRRKKNNVRNCTSLVIFEDYITEKNMVSNS